MQTSFISKIAMAAAISFWVLSLPANAQVDDGAANEKKNPIVVYGQTLKETQEALEECIARGCPPNEEIDAALGHAENQFLEGDYKDSRSTILETIGRNKKYKEKYPVSLSDLYRSNSKVAEHLGEARSYQLSVLEMRESLEAGLDKNDVRIMLADLEVGDSRAKLGYPDEAKRIYNRTQRKAEKMGRPGLATLARIRGITLDTQLALATKRLYLIENVREDIVDLIENPIAGAEKFEVVGKILLAKLDRQTGNINTTQEIISEYAELGEAGKPVLLYSEPIKIDNRTRVKGGNILNSVAVDNFDGRWADIGFWINADGRVSDIEVLRSDGPLEWIQYVERSINSRVYAPLKITQDAPEPATYAIERYTFTSRYTSRTGTRIRQRDPQPRIEKLDLTPEPPAQESSEEN